MGAYGSPELHPALRDSEYDRLQQLKWKYCEKCGHKFLETEKACPKCGYKPKPKRSGWTVFWAVVAIMEAGLMFLPYLPNSTGGSIPPPPTAKMYTQAEVNAMIDAKEEEMIQQFADELKEAFEDIGNSPMEVLFPSMSEKQQPYSDITISQKNALQSAKTYLLYAAFSYGGLINQLEYEKYSHEDAVFAADNCGADWYEQAAKCAKTYLALTAFSRDGLIDQLMYEGFTKEQAEYGATTNGY